MGVVVTADDVSVGQNAIADNVSVGDRLHGSECEASSAATPAMVTTDAPLAGGQSVHNDGPGA
jgi:hypothetical protein